MGITVAIPFYNAERYLLDAIRSVFAQTYREWELILIDDGSTDRSLEIANSINDPRVRVVSDGKNKKLASRLNEATKLAKYEYIARMDADDLMVPDRLQIQYDILMSNPQYDLVTSGIYSVLNDLTIVGKRGSAYWGATFEEIISRKKGITHAAILARRSWYERNKYDEKLTIAQDLELWVRTSLKKDLKVISLSNPLYIYREENNVLLNKLLRAYSVENQLVRKYKGRINKYYMILLLKSWVVKFLKIVKVDRDFQRRRNFVLSSVEVCSYKNAIDKINETKVPLL